MTESYWMPLLSAAQAAHARAYAPYSRFPVGAAVVGAGGEIHAGGNVENASFGLTVCAERNAIAAAVAAGLQPGGLQLLAVYSREDEPVMPCGACRQVIAEFAAPDCRVRCFFGGGYREFSIDELLPHGFRLGSRS